MSDISRLRAQLEHAEEQLMLADDICERSIWGSMVDMIEEAIADALVTVEAN